MRLLPGSGRCIQGWASYISCSRPVPHHQAHVERPHCCYMRPPAALDTKRNIAVISKSRQGAMVPSKIHSVALI